MSALFQQECWNRFLTVRFYEGRFACFHLNPIIKARSLCGYYQATPANFLAVSLSMQKPHNTSTAALWAKIENQQLENTFDSWAHWVCQHHDFVGGFFNYKNCSDINMVMFVNSLTACSSCFHVYFLCLRKPE